MNKIDSIRKLSRTLYQNFSKRNKRRKEYQATKIPEKPNEEVKPLGLKQEVIKNMFFGEVTKDQEETENLYDAIQRFKQVSQINSQLFIKRFICF